MKILHSTLLLLFFAVLTLAKHECIHSKMKFKPTYENILSPEFKEQYHANREATKERRLQSYQPIRIFADYSALDSIPSATREYIQNHLMPTSIAYFEKTLSVEPFPQTLRFTQSCSSFVPGPEVQAGVDADLIILVNAETSEESYIAYAGACSMSTLNNRPIYGIVNFNLRLLPFETTLDFQENFLTTTHEIGHILGFSEGLYELFVQPGTNTPVSATDTQTFNGETFNVLTVEPLLGKLKDHFGCSSLKGGILENEGGSGSAGSHWERQFFLNEFMTASSITDSLMSEFTLALFEGTGWYQVDYTNVDPFLWGKDTTNANTCDFFDNKCRNPGTGLVSKEPEFCPTIAEEGCTFTARAIGYCGARSRVTDPTLDSDYNYWGDNTIVADPFSNNCPYMRAFSNLDCENPLFATNGFLTQEVYAEGSRCLSGTLSSGGSALAQTTGYCFPVQCSGSNLLVTVGSQTVTCTAAGTQAVTGLSGLITCPDPVAFCARSNPARCYRGCSGKGTCSSNACSCDDGWGGIDCGNRVYKESCSQCSSSTAGKFCYGDKCGCSDPESCSAVIYGSVSIMALIASIFVLFA